MKKMISRLLLAALCAAGAVGARAACPSHFAAPQTDYIARLNQLIDCVAPGGSSSPLTTKGDLYTYGSAAARLAVGANDTMLVADSAQATGNRWTGAISPTTVNGMTVGRGANAVLTDTAVGVSALSSNSGSADRATAVGYQALAAVTSGDDNTAVGYQALSGVTSSAGATAIGSGAGVNATGIGNTLLGYQAGGTTLTSGAQNTVVGALADVAASGNNNSIVIGYQAVGGGTNTTTIGNSSTTAARVYGALTADGIALGVAGSAAGSLKFYNATSGSITESPPTGALGTITQTRPAISGTIVVAPTGSPTMGSCGSSPGVAGNDLGMVVTVGTGGVATSCAVSFATTAANAPACVANSDTDIVAMKMVTTTTTATVSATAPFTASSKLHVVCHRY